jgi:precorrin-2 dehydrogenase/sirohydrochlorin ferrochelatase
MLDVRNRQAIVIGGDRVAAEKAAALSASGARVVVQSEQFCDAVLALSERGAVTLRRKAYTRGDLAGFFVVVAVTGNSALTEQIWDEAQERGQLINSVDVPSRCNFIVPSILRRGQLTIAVSTEGASPGLAKRIREQLEPQFPPAYDAYLQLAAAARTHLRQSNLSYEQRDEFFGDFFQSDILNQLTAGNDTEAIALTVALLRRYGLDVTLEAIRGELRWNETGQTGQARPGHYLSPR